MKTETLRLSDGCVCIRDFRVGDIEKKVEWINNSQNNTYLHYDIPLCVEKTLTWFKNKDNSVRRDCIIEYNGVPVGLLNIDEYNSKAEFYICIGEVAYKGKGIGKAATKLILNYAFSTLHLNKIYLNVDSDNITARKLYEKVGFELEGIFKQDLFHRGSYIERRRYAIFSKL